MKNGGYLSISVWMHIYFFDFSWADAQWLIISSSYTEMTFHSNLCKFILLLEFIFYFFCKPYWNKCHKGKTMGSIVSCAIPTLCNVLLSSLFRWDSPCSALTRLATCGEEQRPFLWLANALRLPRILVYVSEILSNKNVKIIPLKDGCIN